MRFAVLVCLLASALLASASASQQAFKKGHTYSYRFRSQVSSSLLTSEPSMIQQQAATGMQALLKLTFTGDHSARVQLQHVRLGEMQGEVQGGQQQLIPSEMFQKRQLPEEVKEKLEQPFTIQLVDGVVERLNFQDEQESSWSKNIKRAAVNMLQLNLKRNDVQGLRLQSSQPEEEKESRKMGVFTIPEITLEGECETHYTIQKRQPSQRWNEESQESQERDQQVQFNVTKTLNYNKCRRTADVIYGYQVNADQQLRCHKCLKQTEIKTQNVGKTEKQEQLKYAQCQTECQTNQLNNQKNIERSTVAHFELHGNTQKYALRRSKIISQYVVKVQNPEAHNTLSQVVSIAELTLNEQADQSEVPALKKAGKDEILLYNPEWDLSEKRFYMYGDEELNVKRIPFANVQQKVQKAEKHIEEILRQWVEDKEMGYELTTAQTFNKLVQLVRQSSVSELKKIQERALQVAQQVQGSEGQQPQEHAKTLFLDALATAATRNSLHELVHKIKNGQVSTLKAAQLLKIFIANQHSASDRQADLLEQIAQSEQAQQCPILKQTAWLAFGQAVGKICQQQPGQSQKDHFRVEEMCPEAKKEQYMKTMLLQWKDAQDVYNQILALKVIGNAALEKTMPELQKIVTDKRQPTLLRMEAIDALRRLRTSRPEQIQQTLLPIFMDQREQPEIRMASVSMILYTQPEQVVLDQIVFSVQNDRSQNVKSFVLTILESLSKSPSSAEKKIAQHLKAALKVVKITPEQLKASRKYRVPIYVSEQQETEEQNIFIGLVSIFSPSNMIPIYLSSSIQSAFNGDAAREQIKLSFTQKDLEHLYEKLTNVFDRFQTGEDDEQERQSSKDLRQIYNSLGIKSRRTGSYYLSSEESDESSESTKRSSTMGKNTPFGMFVIRTNDVDQFIVPVDEQKLPQMLRKFINGEKPSFQLDSYSELRTQLSAGKRFQQHIAMSIGESKVKIPTSAGLPLAIVWDASVVASVQGKAQAELEIGGEHKIRGELKLRQSGIATHSFYTEVWTPAVVSGVKSLRTVELNHGELKMKLHASRSEVKITIEPPKQEQKERILGLHTLPATYTRKFNWETRTYGGEPRLRTIRNHALEHTQQEFSHEQHRSIRVEGNIHRVSTLKQAINALYTTENNVHVYFKQNQHSPEQVSIRVSGFSFRRAENGEHKQPEFEDFYGQQGQSNRKPFRSLYDDEEEQEYKQMSFHNNQERESRLSGFVGKYQGNKAFKHQLKIELEARTPSQKHRAEIEVQGTCDERLQHCKAVLNAQRTPIFHNEQENWELQSKVQLVMPEHIRNEEPLTEKQSRMLIKAEAEWGQEQRVYVRIQGEPTRKTFWRESADKYSRFLNKFDLVADYQLQKPQRHMVERFYELLKYQMYWNLETMPERRGEEKTIRATLVVDPITRRHANLTIQTPHERVQARNIELPSRIQGISLEHRRPSTSYNSFTQMISSYQYSAECRADDRRVVTFDSVSYRAPLSECYTVLAKDCSRENPRFVVLMKKSEEGEKKIKIITQQNTIELQRQSGKQQIVVKVDGEKITDEEQLSEYGIDKTEYQVYVQQKGVSVRFDGVEALIKINSQYKNINCGLCGHYSTEEGDVFRMSNNKRSQSLKEFHNSYVLKNQECDGKKLQKFYQDRDSEEFQVQQRRPQSAYYRDSFQQQDDDESQSQEQWWSSVEDKKDEKTKPVERTQILEYAQKLCFSMKPVKQCARGMVPDETAEPKSVKVQFFCLERSSSQARRFHRQVRQGKTVTSEGQQPSFFDNVEQPSKCQSAEFY